MGDVGTLSLYSKDTKLNREGAKDAKGFFADLSHLFFFFIVCLNFKTAKFNSIDVSAG